MIAGSSSARRGRASETGTQQIQLFKKEINDANVAVLVYLVVKPIREKHRLAAINTLDETRHARLLLTCGSLPQRAVPHSLGP